MVEPMGVINYTIFIGPSTLDNAIESAGDVKKKNKSQVKRLGTVFIISLYYLAQGHSEDILKGRIGSSRGQNFFRVQDSFYLFLHLNFH